nr:integrase, catalytic region, zinc finger, CCHC-type, peptidase aspartic, catalytic [Tanacetum cinerariifolium]
KHAINLELELQQCKEKINNDMSFKVKKSKDFCKEREQYFVIQDLKAQLQDKGIAISELKKLIEKLKGKSVETKFEKSSVIRQPNAFKSQRPSVLGKPTTFSNSFVEDHRRNVKLPKNKTFVTTCNGSLNAKTLNVKSVSMCDKCVLHDKHDMCVLTSVTKPIKRTVASESNKKPRNFTRKIYEHFSKTCSWWYHKSTPSGYIWKPKSGKENVNSNLVEIVLFIVDSGCSKHMTGNLKLLINFVEKFLGTVKFGNDKIAPILGYGDLVQGTITIKRVYYVEGLNHNLFSIGQFCDVDLEVAFKKSTCFIRDLKGNDLLTDGNSFTYDSTSNLVHDSLNIFNPPLQPPTFSYEFCGNDGYYGHDCSLQDKHCQPEDILELFQRLHNDEQNIYKELAVYINTSNWGRPTIYYDDDDYAIAVTPSLSIEEPDNSLSMRDEHLDTISAIESDEFIKSSVENLVLIPNQFEDFFDSNNESTSTDDDSFSIHNIEYVVASPPDSELVSSEVMEIVILEVG